MSFWACRVNNKPQLIDIWPDNLQCDFDIPVLVILDPLICNVMHERRGRLPFRLCMSLIFYPALKYLLAPFQFEFVVL